MIRKLLLLYAAFFMLAVLQACWIGKCDEKTISGRWSDISLRNGYAEEVSYGYSLKESQDSVMENKLWGVFMEVGYQQVAMERAVITNFFNCAYATQPCDDIYISVHKPIRITVQTLRNYSSEYPENSDVTSLFSEIIPDSSGQWRLFKPLQQSFTLHENYEEAHSFERIMYLTDSTATIDSLVEFKVTVYFNDSTSLSAQTLPVKRRF